MGFVHLHNHTHYSALDGGIKIPKYIDKALSLGMNSLAITDHGNMCGAIEFYKVAKDKGIKPIIGQEFYISPGSRHDREYIKNEISNYHLILLAANNEGYKNLLKLSSIGYLEGFYRKPRIDFDVLAEHSAGLICSSACLAGEIPTMILQKKADKALTVAEKYRELFSDRFFLELQDHNLPEQKIVNEAVVSISKKLDIPLIATNDIHYLEKADARVHEILLCIQTQKTITDEDRMRFGTEEFYFKSTEEMEKIFAEYPDAVYNTQVVADMCDVVLTLGKPVLPDFKVPEGHSLNSYLEELVYKGAYDRFGQEVPDKVKKQISYEMSVISKMGFAGYFLIVWDFISHAKKVGIPVGPGRGSAAGSMISYCLGITELNPQKYNLLFERFLNPDRNEMPDMDIDFCGVRRDEIIQYVKDKYHEDHVTQIMAFNTLKAKAAVKDVARALNIPFNDANKITKMVTGKTIEASLKESKDLKEFYEGSDLSKQLIDTSIKLEGLVRSFGKHAAGIVISKDRITDYVPLYRDAKDGSVCAQFEKNNCEAVGLVKMDFLGLNNLTIIDNALKLIKKHRGKDIDLNKVTLNDKGVYKLLQSADTNGIFQLESSGMQNLLRKLGPTEFEDIIAVSALYRPGPLQSGMADQYCKRKKDSNLITYPHQSIEPVLKDTLGVIIYQEQVMKIAQVMGGFTMSEADKLRKAMGKKLTNIVDDLKPKFLDGAKKKKIDEKIAEEVYDAMAKFAEYGFNKSHSAAYGLVTYQTAYLKVHFTIEYMTALLTGSIGKSTMQEDISKYVSDCKTKNIQVLGPDINMSDYDFTIEGKVIRFGFRAIKGIGDKAIEVIIAAREKCGGFKTLKDFLENIDTTVNKGVIEALIKSGSLNSLHGNRAELFHQMDNLLDRAKKLQEDKRSGQGNLFGEGPVSPSESLDLENMPDWNDKDKLTFEKEVLGLYITGHPLSKYEKEIRAYSSCPIIKMSEEFREGKKRFSIVGILTNLKKKITQTGKEMAIAQLEDMEGTIETIFFPKFYAKNQTLIQPEALVMVVGDVDVDDEENDPKLKLLAVEIKPLKDARMQSISSIHVNMDSLTVDDSTLSRIKSIVESSKGPCPVFFHVRIFPRQKDEVIIKANKVFSVNPSDALIGALSKEVGEDSVRVAFRNNGSCS